MEKINIPLDPKRLKPNEINLKDVHLLLNIVLLYKNESITINNWVRLYHLATIAAVVAIDNFFTKEEDNFILAESFLNFVIYAREYVGSVIGDYEKGHKDAIKIIRGWYYLLINCPEELAQNKYFKKKREILLCKN